MADDIIGLIVLAALTYPVLLVGLGMFVVAVIGKVLGVSTIPTKAVSRGGTAVGIIPRGEVVQIFADIGLKTKLVD